MPLLRRSSVLVLSALLVLGYAAARPTDAAPVPDDPLEALPEMPAVARPAPFELERAMGAECFAPEDLEDDPVSRVLPRGHCWGPMPRHMARAWRAIVPLLPRKLEGVPADLFTKAIYRAVPGFGARPDVVVDVGVGSSFQIVLRSFEGRRPEDTVYAIWAQFCEPEVSGPRWVPDCPESTYGRLVFKLDDGGQARDVTAEIVPLPPQLNAQDRRIFRKHDGFGPYEVLDKLGETSATRWVAVFDLENSPPDSYRRWSAAKARAHFGFTVWNGTRFEWRERVPRALWPCAPAPEGVSCLDSDDVPHGSPWIADDTITSKDD